MELGTNFHSQKIEVPSLLKRGHQMESHQNMMLKIQVILNNQIRTLLKKLRLPLSKIFVVSLRKLVIGL